MPRLSAKDKKEAAQTQADRKWWNELATLFGWVLNGWSYRDMASFYRNHDPRQSLPLIEITSDLRKELLEALSKAYAQGYQDGQKGVPKNTYAAMIDA